MRKEARSPSSTEQKEVTIFTRASVLQDVNLYIGVKYYKSQTKHIFRKSSVILNAPLVGPGTEGDFISHFSF